MLVRYASLIALAAALAQALPLNINLGAYSPALVVGDGEISFGGEAGAEALVNSLEGAAVSGATGAANAAAAPAAEPVATNAGVISEKVSELHMAIPIIVIAARM